MSTIINFTVENAPENILSGRKTLTFRRHKPDSELLLPHQKVTLWWDIESPESYPIADAVLTHVFIIPNMSFFLEHDVNEHIAKRDGFDSIEDMRAFFEGYYTKKKLKGKFRMIMWRLSL